MGTRIAVLLTVLSHVASGASGRVSESDVFQAIRNGDLVFLRAHVSRSNINTRDPRGATLLMHAAAFGNIEAMRLLLDAGAHVNAKNALGATALLWSARNPEKARLLIGRGADVNASSKQARTPLMLAAMRDGGSEIVELMLAKGADVNATDSLGETALALAAEAGDPETMRLLIARGADVAVRNRRGETPLIHASKSRRPQAARLLIQKGVDVNVASTSFVRVRHGEIALIKLTALHRAAAFGIRDMVTDLLRAGANVNARDSRGMTALMLSVGAENQNPEVVRALIQAKADVNARSNTGETALDWAEKFGYPEVIAALKEAGAKSGVAYEPPKKPEGPRLEPAAALARSLDLLQRSSTEFFKQSGCVGCHHQPMAARAQQLAKAAGLGVNEAASHEQLLQMKAQWAPLQEEFLQVMNPGGGPNRLGENLLGLEAAGQSADMILDSAVVDLAESQTTEGTWPAGEEQPRPPMTESLIASTARTIRVLQAYMIPARKAEFTSRIARARAWLNNAKPVSTDEFAMRLLGLWWSGAEKERVQEAARALLGLQHEDGGWSGNPYLQSDAFATGEALYALYESGSLRPMDGQYERGVANLLSTQYPDGSWYVRSRSVKFQPYFESGFPFGHDQWISAAATAWASMAIAPASMAIAPANFRSSR